VTGTILTIAASVIGFAIWLWKRTLVENDTPGSIQKKYEEESRRIISHEDVSALNRSIDERLRAISRNTSGQGSDKIEEK